MTDSDRTARHFARFCGLVDPFRTAQDRKADLPENEAEWSWAARYAEFHGIRPALSEVLEVCAPDTALCASLAGWRQFHRLRVMQMTAEIVALARAFDAAGLAALFFKGAVLGEQVYGGAQNREFNDIDLLVDPACRDLAGELLEAAGYCPIVRDPAMRRAFFEFGEQHMYRNAETGSVVDLHWAFVGKRPFPLSGAEALRNRAGLALAGTQVSVPAPADLALILAGHGHKEGWASFGWALDLARFAARHPDFDWTRAAARARARGSARTVLAGILLTHRLFGQTLDAALLAEARARRGLADQIETIVSGYGKLALRRHEDDLMGGFRLCETPLQKARFWWTLLTAPSIGDYEAMPLPRGWWWLYPFTRPLRLTLRRLRGAAPETSEFWETERVAARADG